MSPLPARRRRRWPKGFASLFTPLDTANSVGSPPPCGEGSGVGVEVVWIALANLLLPPLPNPPPQGGREQTAQAARPYRPQPRRPQGRIDYNPYLPGRK